MAKKKAAPKKKSSQQLETDRRYDSKRGFAWVPEHTARDAWAQVGELRKLSEKQAKKIESLEQEISRLKASL